MPRKPQFKIEPDHWYALEVWTEKGGKPYTHHSPIRVVAVQSVKNGWEEIRLRFFCALDEEGPLEREYRLHVLHRSSAYLLARSFEHKHHRCLWIGELTREWLEPHADKELKRALEAGCDLKKCLDAFFRRK